MLENHLKYVTYGKVGGLIIEPVLGFGGIFPLDNGFMKKSFELIREYGGVCIADEV